MAEEITETPEIQGKMSELPLWSDFQRLGNLLNEAQNLAKENTKNNPETLLDFFVVLKEIFKAIYPLTQGMPKAEAMKERMQRAEKITKRVYWGILSERTKKIPMELFQELDEIHQEVLILKQDTNLGIKVKTRMTDRNKLEQALQ